MLKLTPCADLSKSVQYRFLWWTALNHLNMHRCKACLATKTSMIVSYTIT